jgi:hypothetical protein
MAPGTVAGWDGKVFRAIACDGPLAGQTLESTAPKYRRPVRLPWRLGHRKPHDWCMDPRTGDPYQPRQITWTYELRDVCAPVQDPRFVAVWCFMGDAGPDADELTIAAHFGYTLDGVTYDEVVA